MRRPLAVLLMLGSAAANAAGVDPGAIDFETDVRPILEARCVECHAYGRSKGGFSLETRASMLEHGEAVVPGDVAGSLLLAPVRGDDPDMVMAQPRGPRSAMNLSARLADRSR
jgi:hypothetical protein